MQLRYSTILTIDEKYKEIPEMYTCLRALYIKKREVLEYYNEETNRWEEPYHSSDYRVVVT